MKTGLEVGRQYKGLHMKGLEFGDSVRALENIVVRGNIVEMLTVLPNDHQIKGLN